MDPSWGPQAGDNDGGLKRLNPFRWAGGEAQGSVEFGTSGGLLLALKRVSGPYSIVGL